MGAPNLPITALTIRDPFMRRAFAKNATQGLSMKNGVKINGKIPSDEIYGIILLS